MLTCTTEHTRKPGKCLHCETQAVTEQRTSHGIRRSVCTHCGFITVTMKQLDHNADVLTEIMADKKR